MIFEKTEDVCTVMDDDINDLIIQELASLMPVIISSSDCPEEKWSEPPQKTT